MAKEDTILINKMYVGDYLGENIGHEVINLLKADNGENYIYVLEDGTIAAKWDDKIKTILLARQAGKNTWEILAKATVKEQLVKQSDDNIKKINGKDEKLKELSSINHEELKKQGANYGGQELSKIFENNIRNEMAIYATFKVKDVLRPEKPLYIEFNQEKEKNKDGTIIQNEDTIKENTDYKTVITINHGYPKSSQTTFIEKGSGAYKVLNQVLALELPEDSTSKKENIEQTIEWKKDNATMTIDEIKNDKRFKNIIDNNSNFIDIIDKHHAELTYSNLFQHIFQLSPELFQKFARNKEYGLGIVNFGNNLDVQREKANIDLLISDNEGNIIVIENKIKSGINGEKYDIAGDIISNQLLDYIAYTNGFKRKRNKNNDENQKTEDNNLIYEKNKDLEEQFKDKVKNYFIFVPQYNKIDEDIINKNLDKYIEGLKEFYEIKSKESNKRIAEDEVKVIKERFKKSTYKIITYKNIYKFFNQDEIKKNYGHIQYYNEFLYALSKHTNDIDNVLEVEMFRRFIARINKLTPDGK